MKTVIQGYEPLSLFRYFEEISAIPRGSGNEAGIADYLVDGYTVVMNIEELERPAALRLIDFLLGALQVLGGELRRVTKTTLVLSPRPGELVEEEEQEEDDRL